jgi:hypothetical protein
VVAVAMMIAGAAGTMIATAMTADGIASVVSRYYS